MGKYIAFIAAFMCLNSFAQRNEWQIQIGYSQASQSKDIANIFQTSFWNQNIHSAFMGAEYYCNFDTSNAFGVGAQVVEKGFKNSYAMDYGTYVYDLQYFFKQTYFELPLLYRFKLWKFYSISVGGFGDFLVRTAQGSSWKRIYDNGAIQDYRSTSWNPNVFRRYDAGIMLRASAQLAKSLFGNFTFTRGFIRPYKYNSGEVNYNEVFMVGLSYKFK